MTLWLKQSTAATLKFGPFLDDTDGNTVEGGLTITQADVRLSKNGGNIAQKNDAAAATHDELGFYDVDLDATDTNTLGRLMVAIHESGALSVFQYFMVVPANVWDSTFGADYLQVDAIQIGSSSAVVTNLVAQYDGSTGLTGETFPATQAQLDAIALTGAAVNTAAESYLLTTGTQSSGTVSDTAALDGTNHEHTDTAGAMDLYYQFAIGGDGVPTSVTVSGYLNGNNDDLEVYAYNWGGTSWDQIGELNGKALATNEVNNYTLFTSHVGTGANLGKVRIRFTDGAFTLTTATLAIDQIFTSYAVVSRSVGYADGAIWVDTNGSNTNTESFVDGTADNPVSTWAAALTLSGNLNINRFHIINGSTITLSANSDGYTLLGDNWNLALGGQSIAEISIHGPHITGIGTAASGRIHLHNCHIGAATLPPAVLHTCGIGEDSGQFTAGSDGEYVFEDCFSKAPGAAVPALVFTGLGSATGINNRGWKGGSNYTLDSFCTLSHEVLAGGGQTITTGGADVELRGICRSVTAVLSAAETFQFVGVTGPIALSGTTTATVNLYGVSASLADTTSAATVTDQTISQAHRSGYDYGAIWLDTNASNTNTELYIDGTADNPVSTWAAVLTLNTALGQLNRVHIANGSTVTLSSNSDNCVLFGEAWILALGGRSIDSAYFSGAAVTGIGTAVAANPPVFIDCTLGAVTLPASVLRNCGIGEDGGQFTAGSDGEYVFDNCFSMVPGSGAPTLVFTGLGSATGINNRGWKGGANYTLDSDCTLSHEVLAGGGQTFTTGGADVELRGICRSVTAVLSAAETFQFVGVTGPIALSGTTTATVNLYGVSASLADTTSAATVTDLTVSQANINTEADTALSDIGLDHLLAAAVIGADVVDDSVIAQLASKSGTADWDSFNNTTDSQEAIADSVSGSALTVADIADGVWDEAANSHTTPGSTGAVLNDIPDNVWDEVMEAGAASIARTARQWMRLLASANFGETAGEGAWSAKSIDGNKTRISATLTATGQRSNVSTLDGS